MLLPEQSPVYIKTTGTLVVLCTRVLLCSIVVCCCVLWCVFVCCCVLLCVVVCKRSGEVSLTRGSNPGRRSFVLQVLKTESYDEFESQSGSEASVV